MIPSARASFRNRMSLIDEFMPEYDFNERHQTLVPAPKEIVRIASEQWPPSESFAWRLLFRLRGLGRIDGALRDWSEAEGFLRLGETDDEVVYGNIGRFWALDERPTLVRPRTVEEFLSFDDPTYATAVINLRVEAVAPTRTRLYTETRVRGLGPHARRRFRLYWLLIRPFSGLLRRAMLSGIRRRAVMEYASESRKELAK